MAHRDGYGGSGDVEKFSAKTGDVAGLPERYLHASRTCGLLNDDSGEAAGDRRAKRGAEDSQGALTYKPDAPSRRAKKTGRGLGATFLGCRGCLHFHGFPGTLRTIHHRFVTILNSIVLIGLAHRPQ